MIEVESCLIRRPSRLLATVKPLTTVLPALHDTAARLPGVPSVASGKGPARLASLAVGRPVGNAQRTLQSSSLLPNTAWPLGLLSFAT